MVHQGKALKKIINDAGYSIDQFSEMIGNHPKSFHKTLREEKVSQKTILKVLSYIEFKLDELYLEPVETWREKYFQTQELAYNDLLKRNEEFADRKELTILIKEGLELIKQNQKVIISEIESLKKGQSALYEDKEKYKTKN